MASRGPAGRAGAGGRFAQFKLVLLGMLGFYQDHATRLTRCQANLLLERYSIAIVPAMRSIANPSLSVIISPTICERPV